jgi:hypothetical protein
MIYPLRCKGVSPSKLGDPRTHGSRSEGIQRATTPSCLALWAATQRTFACSLLLVGRTLGGYSCHSDSLTARLRSRTGAWGLRQRVCRMTPVLGMSNTSGRNIGARPGAPSRGPQVGAGPPRHRYEFGERPRPGVPRASPMRSAGSKSGEHQHVEELRAGAGPSVQDGPELGPRHNSSRCPSPNSSNVSRVGRTWPRTNSEGRSPFRSPVMWAYAVSAQRSVLGGSRKVRGVGPLCV